MQFDCELVLCANDHELRLPHTFLAEISPGTFLRLEGRDWIVTEIQDGDKPRVICGPPGESSRPELIALATVDEAPLRQG